MKISNNVFIRFEDQIAGGTLYIYDKRLDKVYKTNRVMYDLVLLLNEDTEYEKIKEKFSEKYSEFSEQEINNFLEKALEKLRILNVIEVK